MKMTPDQLQKDANEVPKIDDNAIKTITTLARKQVKIENQILKTEEHLKQLKKQLVQVSSIDLPEKMTELGLEEFKLNNGFKLEAKEHLFVSISKENKNAAFTWLIKKGFGEIIKTNAQVMFDQGDTEQIKVFKKIFEQRKILRDLPHFIDQSIHHQTLKAFVKEQREKGVDFPKSFTIFPQKISKIIPPKKMKGKKKK